MIDWIDKVKVVVELTESRSRRVGIANIQNGSWAHSYGNLLVGMAWKNGTVPVNSFVYDWNETSSFFNFI